MIVAGVVEALADHLAEQRARVVAAWRENRDVASLSRWMAREAADALWEARGALGTTPAPAAVWQPAAPMFLLASAPGTPSTPPPPSDRDLWIDVVAVPSPSGAEIAAKAVAAGRARFARLRETRRAGTFATIAIAIVRGDDELHAVDLLVAELGDPHARARFGDPAAPAAIVGDVLGWSV